MDIKLHVGFDEYGCVIQDLKMEKVMGTSSEVEGLYIFNTENRMSIGKPTYVMSCEIRHHAKKVREPFPLSKHKIKALEEQSFVNDQASVQIGEENFPEGNVSKNNNVLTYIFNTKESNGVTRSNRESKLPANLNDFVLDN
ncbi:hypothetical protein Tco_1500061 [Tanacetum coccineum]